MAVTPQAVTSTMQQSVYTPTIDALASFNLKPQYIGELYQRYGLGFGIKDMLELSGRTINLASSTPKIIEEGALEKSITLAVATAVTTAGGDAVFEVVTSGCYCGIGDIVVVPPYYLATAQKAKLIPAEYQIVSKATNGSNTQFTATPLNATVADIDTQIPIATKLMVTGGSYAPGSSGPLAKVSYPYEKTFYTSIKRAAFKLWGSQQSEQRYTEDLRNGKKGQFSKASIEAEFLLDSWMNDDLLVGQQNTNSLTLTADDSTTSAVRGTVGLLSHLYDYASKQTYTAGSYELSDIFDIKDVMISQGVVANRALMCAGPDLARDLQLSVGLESIKEYSGGTDFMTKLTEMNINFTAFHINGLDLMIKELTSLAHPEKLGNGSYDALKRFGFVVPEAFVSLKESTDSNARTFKASNINIGYKNSNGENRTRIVQIIAGVNGMGYQATNRYDQVQGELLTEYALIVAKANQLIRIMSDAD